MSNKKQTPEEASHEYFKRGQLGFEKASDTEEAFLKGAKWQQERMYSEEEVLDLISGFIDSQCNNFVSFQIIQEWFKQYKKITDEHTTK